MQESGGGPVESPCRAASRLQRWLAADAKLERTSLSAGGLLSTRHGDSRVRFAAAVFLIEKLDQ